MILTLRVTWKNLSHVGDGGFESGRDGESWGRVDGKPPGCDLIGTDALLPLLFLPGWGSSSLAVLGGLTLHQSASSQH